MEIRSGRMPAKKAGGESASPRRAGGVKADLRRTSEDGGGRVVEGAEEPSCKVYGTNYRKKMCDRSRVLNNLHFNQRGGNMFKDKFLTCPSAGGLIVSCVCCLSCCGWRPAAWFVLTSWQLARGCLFKSSDWKMARRTSGIGQPAPRLSSPTPGRHWRGPRMWVSRDTLQP